MASATFSGDSRYRLDLSTWVTGTTINASISVTKTGGSGFWTNDAQGWSINIAGVNFPGSWTYDFRASTPQTIGIATRSQGVGYGTHYISANVNMDSGIGSAGTGEYQSVAGPPGATCCFTVDQATPSSLRYQFSGTTDNGSGILEWQAQVATDAGFTQNVQTVGSSGTTTFGGLAPGTTHYFRSRGRNGVGWGPYGSTASGSTLPATAPTQTVTPSASGQSAALNFSPPSGASGVTSYEVEYRPVPPGTPVVARSFPTNLGSVTGLTPGVTYEWRTSAKFGSYQSPWTSWVAVTQPNPNTSPGDFFDGNKAAGADVTYSWTGTANNSTSRATGRGVDGWEVVAPAGSAVCQQITGGFSGTFAARLVVKLDTTAAGVQLGMADAAGKRAEVQPTATYVGSIYVKPSRAQRLAARLAFIDASGAIVGTAIVGTAQLVSSTTSWTRLTVAGVAPADAAFAIVRAIDVTGTGWSAWLSGEFMDADAAMVSLATLFPYFDGSTPDGSDFIYEWLGTAHASASRRIQAPSQPFIVQDPDCAVIPSAPRPPAIVNDCVTTIGEWRRYAFPIGASEVSEWLDVVPTVYLSTLGAAATQVRVRFYRNPDALPPTQYENWDVWDIELYLSYMPANATVELDGITQSAIGVLQGRTNVPMSHLLYGTNGGVVTWPTLSCGDAYIMTVDTPLELAAGGLQVVVETRQRAM